MPRVRRWPRWTATSQLLGGGPRGSLGEWRSWLLGVIGCGAHRLRHRRRPPAPPPLPVRRPTARRRHRARGDRLSDRPRRGVAGQQLSMAGPARQPVRRATWHRRARGRAEDPDGDRLPGRDPHRRGLDHDVRRPPSPFRAVRLRHRRQPRGCRARRHQRAPDDHVHVRADGRALRGQCSRSSRPASTPPSPVSA